LKGILGVFCGLYAFIWGWMNAGRLGLKNIMLPGPPASSHDHPGRHDRVLVVLGRHVGDQ
jgi:hypothetical protein